MRIAFHPTLPHTHTHTHTHTHVDAASQLKNDGTNAGGHVDSVTVRDKAHRQATIKATDGLFHFWRKQAGAELCQAQTSLS